MIKDVPKQFVKLAHKLESKAIDAGYDYVSITFNTGKWANNGHNELRVTGFDLDGKIHIYSEGGE